MTNSKIGTIEAILLVLSVLFPITVTSSAKQFINVYKSSAILSVIYISIIATLISLIILKLFKKFPSNDIIDVSDFLGGKIFKNIIGSIFIIYFIFSSAMILRDFSESLNVVYYPYTEIKYIMLSFIFAIAIANNFGFSSSIVKTVVLVFPMFLLSIILLFLGNLENFSFYRIFPILGEGLNKTFLISLSNIGSFAGITYIYLLPPLLKEPNNFKKVSIVSTILSGILILICVATLLLMFSIFIDVDEIMPLFTVSRYIEFGTFFQRFESIFLLVWTICFCCYLVISCKFCSTIFGKMFNIKDCSQIFIVFVFLLYALSLLPENYSVTNFYETNLYKYFTLFIIALGLFILILSNLKSKKKVGKDDAGYD